MCWKKDRHEVTHDIQRKRTTFVMKIAHGHLRKSLFLLQHDFLVHLKDSSISRVHVFSRSRRHYTENPTFTEGINCRIIMHNPEGLFNMFFKEVAHLVSLNIFDIYNCNLHAIYQNHIY